MIDDQERQHQVRDLQSRLHIFQGLVSVLGDPHAFVDVVIQGADMTDALRSLSASYGLSDIQAQAALDLQFRRLDQTSQSKIRAELVDIRTELARLTTT